MGGVVQATVRALYHAAANASHFNITRDTVNGEDGHMEKNPTMRPGKHDKTILDALRENPRSAIELMIVCFKRGIPRTSYYRTLKRLIEHGIIERIDIIKIAEQNKEADSEVSARAIER